MPSDPTDTAANNEPPLLPWIDRPITGRVDCGEGWWPIIEALDIALRGIYPDYQVVQVKEKFGQLRIYLDTVPTEMRDDVYSRVAAAEIQSVTICEDCGQPGELRIGGWMRTLCDTCQERRPKTRMAP